MIRFVTLVAVAGCTSHGSAPTCGGGEVSFARDVAPLIDHCGGELCHGGLGKSWPYARLVNAPSTQCDRVLVVPGDPDASYLLHKLAGTDMCTGDRMPKLGMPFGDADMQTITDWICAGAPDN